MPRNQFSKPLAAAALALILLMSLAVFAEQPAQPAPACPEQGADFPTPEQKAQIAKLIKTIETQPDALIVNNNGYVVRPPDHNPYNKDGSRNQNFVVAPDAAQGKAGAAISNERLRTDAVKELVKFGRAAVPQVVAAIVNEGSKHRYLYAYVLGEIKDPRAVPALIKYMEDGKMKLTAADTYKKFGDAKMAGQMEEEGNAMITDAAGGLQQITGEKYGADITKWRGWWDANKAKYGTPLPLVLETADPPPGSPTYVPPAANP